MKNLRPVLRNNVVSFLDREEQEVFCVHAPCMKDAGGEKIRDNPSEPYRNRSRCVQDHISAGIWNGWDLRTACFR